MKKLLCVLLVAMLLVALTACDEAKTETMTHEVSDKETTKTPDPAVGPGTVERGDEVDDETTPVIPEGEAIIIKISVYHGDGETAETRFSTIKGYTLAQTLLDRTFITEDMMTVDGERVNPELGTSWSLYINGIFTTESWDQILVTENAEYAFEFTSEIEYEEFPEEVEMEEEFIEEEEPEYVPDPEV